MNTTLRKSLIAGAIAALVSSPSWAAGTTTDADAQRGDQATQMERGGTYGTPGAAGAAAGEAGAQAGTSALYSMTPQQLRRMDVVDATGEDIGNVKSVVRSQDQESNIQVVISSGGFLGVGGRDVAVPLDELSLVDDKLHISATKQELEARPEYQQEQFVELQPSDQPISDFAAFEPDQQQQQPRAPEPHDPTTPGMGTSPAEGGTPGTTAPGRDMPPAGTPGDTLQR